MAQVTDVPKKKGRNWILIGLAGVGGLCVICVIFSMIWAQTPAGQSAMATNTAEALAQANADATEAARSTNTPEPTATTGPTETPAPSTNTPEPTATIEPTATPEPTATLVPTPAPEPIVLSGSGNDVVDVEKWDGLAIARITHTGGGNFAIVTYDADGEYLNLLVNDLGNYMGTRVLDFDGEKVTRFEVSAEGNWQIEILPLSAAESVDVPSEISGQGDMVYLLNSTVDTLDATADEGNFAIIGYTIDGDYDDLIVNEITPYEGTSLVPRSTSVLSIETRGAWTITLSE